MFKFKEKNIKFLRYICSVKKITRFNIYAFIPFLAIGI